LSVHFIEQILLVKENMNKSFYIPNLNGIRFLAAFVVILGHIELTRKWLGLDNLIDHGSSFFEKGGHLGVLLFFVLSGYLITLLLLKEKDKEGTVNYRWFIVRRALRIWPVYFLLVITVLFFIHGIDSFQSLDKVICFLLIAPNVSAAFFGGIKYISHLWSIGVEEQFYLIWPFCAKYFNEKVFVIAMLVIAVFLPIVPHVMDWLAIRVLDYSFLFKGVKSFLNYFLINAMAVGGLLAYIQFKKGDVIKKSIYKYGLVIIGFALWLFPLPGGLLSSYLYPVAFGLLIYSLSNLPKLFLFENSLISYLGKISYGLYCYHWLVVYFVIESVSNNSWVVYSLSILGTIALAMLSFELMEKNVLKFKSRFALIKT